MLSSFTHSQVVPKMYEFLCSVEHKRILKNVGNQDPTDFQSIFFFFHMEVNGCRQLSGYQHSSKYRLLCYTEDRHEGE